MILALALAAATGTLSVGGWIACRNRPSARARRLVRRAVHLIESESDHLDKIIGQAEKALIKSAAAYAAKSVQNQLAAVPVEDLKNYGAVNVRWSALRGSGIRTAADLKHLGPARMQSRPGIGPVSSWKIQEAIDLLDQKVRDTPISPPAVGDTSREGRSTIRAAASHAHTGWDRPGR